MSYRKRKDKKKAVETPAASSAPVPGIPAMSEKPFLFKSMPDSEYRGLMQQVRDADKFRVAVQEDINNNGPRHQEWLKSQGNAMLSKSWSQLPNADAKRSPKTWFFDPLALQYSLGYKERHYNVSYEMLKKVSTQLAIIGAIINTRIAQITSFAQPYRHTRSLGFVIKHKNPDHKTSQSEVEFIKELESFILYCGRAEPNPYTRGKRDDFVTFLSKIVRDSLTMDALAFEIVPDGYGLPYEFMAVDASTIRYASDDEYVGVNSSYHSRDGFVPGAPSRFANLYEGRPYVDDAILQGSDGNPVDYIQLVNGQIYNVYSTRELAYGIRNPRTDIYTQGYGFSEIEQMITTVTSHLFAEEYNRAFFTRGSSHSGILNIKGGNWSQEEMEDFQRQWKAQVQGVENAFSTPVLQADGGVEWIDTNRSNREMEFNTWMEYLIKISCFTGNQLVNTEEGFIPIKDIKPGQKVYSHTGKLRKVVNTQESTHKGKLKHIRVGGTVIECTPEHPFYVCRADRGVSVDGYVNTKGNIRAILEPEWRTAEELSEGLDFLAIPKKTYQGSEAKELVTLDLAEYVSNFKLSEDGLKIAPKANRVSWLPRYLEVDEDFGFYLGLYVSEGNCTEYGAYHCFSAEESELVANVAAMGNKLGILPREYKAKESTSNITLSSRIFCDFLVESCGKCAVDKKIPDVIFRSPPAVQQAFISGLVAGDGSVPNFKNSSTATVTISSVSDTLITQLRSLLLEQNILSNRYRNIVSKGFYSENKASRIDVTGSEAVKISEWLSGVKGDRIRNRVADLKLANLNNHFETPSYFLVPVTETWESDFDGLVYNLEVEEDHTYQVDRFAVHNCAIYKIDPAEINFDMQGGVQQTPLFESSQEWKLKASRDRGLKPLLGFIAKVINENVIDRIDDHFALEFVGLDELSEQDKHNMLVEQISSYLTLNEARRQLDLGDVEGGDIPMNPTYLEAMRLQLEQKQMEQAPQEGQDPAMEGNGSYLAGSMEETDDESPNYSGNFGLFSDLDGDSGGEQQ